MIKKISTNFDYNLTNTKANKIQKTQSITLNKIDIIKQQIQNKTYKIDIQQTAEAMAKALLK